MTPRRLNRGLLVCLLVAGAVSRAFAWQLLIADDEAETLAVDAAGDPVVGGGRVVKLRAEDGTARWTWDVGVTHELRLDAGGDVYVAAQIHAGSYWWQSEFLVARLAGGSGAELWRHQVPGALGGEEAARRVVLDGAGDVIAAGRRFDGADYGYRVVKLSGATGAELWHVDGADEPLALAVDASNDVIFSYGSRFTSGWITKLSGADGSVLWTHGPEASVASAMAVDAAGDLVTADERGTLVAKRSGTDGSVVWTQPAAGGVALALDSSGDVVTVGIAASGVRLASVWKLSGPTGAVLWEVHDGDYYGVYYAVTFDAAGQIVVAGGPTERFGLYTYPSMTAAVLSPADGVEVWRKEFHIDRLPLSVNSARGVGVAAGGRVVMAGEFRESNGSVHLGVVSVGGPSAGKRLLVQDGAAPSVRKLVFSATGPELLVGTPGGAGNPLAVGATVELYNPVTGETATTSLPPLGWKPLGSDTYLYSDASQLLGPCTRAKLTGRRDAAFGTRLGGLSLACKGALLGFTLDEPTQGALGLRFRVGPIEQCFLFGGTVARDRPVTPTRTGLFQAKDAPAPVTCP